MTEDEARQWLARFVSRGTLDQLDCYTALLLEEAKRQNLLSASSQKQVLARHIVDSAQLAHFGPPRASWIDLGSGAGLPGIVTAIITGNPTSLVESRRLRAEFLARVVETLALTHVTILAEQVEQVAPAAAGVITARAFAPLTRLLSAGFRFSRPDTVWILPKGKSAAEELASIETTWHGRFSMEQSVTDPESAIIIAREVRSRRSASVPC